MVRRFRFAAFGVLILVAFGIVCAQDMEDFKKMSPEENAELMTDWMKSTLALEESQVSPVYDINLKYAKKNREIANSGEKKLRLYKKLKNSSQEKDKELNKVFTKAQYRIYQEKKEEMKAKVKQRAQGKRR